MAIVDWEKDGTVAIMSMNNGENRHDPEWTEIMLKTYAEIMADPEIKSIVLTSSDPKYFCLGINTDWMNKALADGDYPAISTWFHRNNELFKALLMSPVPTIAAITGHAFGNGAMLAGSCDFRFMRADKGFFCLPEVDLGIQPAPSMFEYLKRIMPYPFFLNMILSGEKIGAAELERNNVIIKACENSEKTLEEAIAFAKKFNKSRTTVAELKRRFYKHIEDKMINEDPIYFDYIPERLQEGQAPVFMFTPLT
jgi:enoyl-CoA hydratase/carnithine racemase